MPTEVFDGTEPDVDPATGDERATDIESETVKARELLDRLMAEGAW